MEICPIAVLKCCLPSSIDDYKLKNEMFDCPDFLCPCYPVRSLIYSRCSHRWIRACIDPRTAAVNQPLRRAGLAEDHSQHAYSTEASTYHFSHHMNSQNYCGGGSTNPAYLFRQTLEVSAVTFLPTSFPGRSIATIGF